MRKSGGGPVDKEYYVEYGSERAWFDAMVIRLRNGVSTEILIDAKGRYERFVNAGEVEFQSWWAKQKKSGLGGEIAQARRQVRVANGRMVEWHCSERETARAFNGVFDNDDQLSGRIRAVYKPMVDEAG